MRSLPSLSATSQPSVAPTSSSRTNSPSSTCRRKRKRPADDEFTRVSRQKCHGSRQVSLSLHERLYSLIQELDLCETSAEPHMEKSVTCEESSSVTNATAPQHSFPELRSLTNPALGAECQSRGEFCAFSSAATFGVYPTEKKSSQASTVTSPTNIQYHSISPMQCSLPLPNWQHGHEPHCSSSSLQQVQKHSLTHAPKCVSGVSRRILYSDNSPNISPLSSRLIHKRRNSIDGCYLMLGKGCRRASCDYLCCPSNSTCSARSSQEIANTGKLSTFSRFTTKSSCNAPTPTTTTQMPYHPLCDSSTAQRSHIAMGLPLRASISSQQLHYHQIGIHDHATHTFSRQSEQHRRLIQRVESNFHAIQEAMKTTHTNLFTRVGQFVGNAANVDGEWKMHLSKPIVLLDQNLFVLGVSNAFCEMLGYSIDDMSSFFAPYFFYKHVFEDEFYVNFHQQMIRNGIQRASATQTWMRKDGTACTVRNILHIEEKPRQDMNGAVVAWSELAPMD